MDGRQNRSKMLQPKAEQYDVGVLVGRFQVADLHDGHHELLQSVCGAHDKVIVVLGVSPLMNTLQNPLDKGARQQMIRTAYPDVDVMYITDRPDDVDWSRALDKMIIENITPAQSAVLYGSRDGFLDHYTGNLPMVELEATKFLSGTAARKRIAASATRNSPDFRAGVVWASSARYPTSYATVDIAILNETRDEVLLARKPGERKLRFVGGFADPGSDSYEADARRETREETGLEVSDPIYIGSALVDDWRYRNEQDKIKTMLFVVTRLYGSPKPMDDIEALEWLPGARLQHDVVGTEDIFVPEHKPLAALLYNYLSKEA